MSLSAVPVGNPMAPPGRHSYGDILKSSAVIAGSSAITVVIGIVRTKAMAMLLGPSGYGAMGAFVLITELARSVAQMGLNGSGVRQIADAVASNDEARIAHTATVLRRMSLLCGLVGAAVVALGARPIAQITFGDDRHAGAVALLGLVVFFAVVAGGHTALLQGMRRIGDMARLAVVGSTMGTLIGVPMVYVWGEQGLAPTLVLVAACTAASAWWYSRRVAVAPAPLGDVETLRASGGLLRLGLAFMASGLLTIGAAYAVRIMVLRMDGLESAGVYYAAWTLGVLYVGFVLQAMGTDFYPRLVGTIADDAKSNRLVNEQTQISLLLAVPGVLATLTFAPVVITLLYSPKFAPSVEVLRWICLGMTLRVMTWPVGYLVVAKNRQLLFFGIEAAWAAVNVTLTWICVHRFGVVGAGMAFFASYVFHGVLLYPIVRRLSGFRWSAANLRTAAAGGAAIAVVFAGVQLLGPRSGLLLGAAVTLVGSVVCLRRLVALAEPERLPRSVGRLLRLLGSA